ncbi:MAG: hypothetical protein KAS32_07725 [Candidatus Peribacteraceae bacterium]|nr:hypothetical protein [Candidatus Peribacteraceae bacterium]
MKNTEGQEDIKALFYKPVKFGTDVARYRDLVETSDDYSALLAAWQRSMDIIEIMDS